MSITGPIPENIKRCMPPEERPAGPAGWTEEEAQEACETRSEKELQKQIKWYLCLNSYPYSNSRMDKKTTTARGNADFWICGPHGRCVTVECKVGGNTHTDEQVAFKKAVEARDGVHLICSRLEQLKAILDDLKASVDGGTS